MAFPLGKTARVFLAGYDFSGNLNGYDSELSVGTEDTTCFGPSLHKTQAPTIVESKISIKGFYTHSVAPDVSGFVNVLHTNLRADAVGLEVDPGSGTSPAAGDLADLWVSTALDRKLSVEASSYVKLDAEIHARDGLHMGEVLEGLTAYSGSPFVSTYYDQGGGAWVDATYRYQVVLQVTAYTSGLAAVVVQTSPDHSAWTTRGTFPAITAIGGYVLDLNTTLARYIRISATGVATIISAWARTY